MSNDKSPKKSHDSKQESFIDPDFEVTEANSDKTEFVGGTSNFGDENDDNLKSSNIDDDELEIETPTASSAVPIDDFSESTDEFDQEPEQIPQPEESTKNIDESQQITQMPEKDILSKSEINEIKNSLFKTEEYLSQKEKENLISKINSGTSTTEETTKKSVSNINKSFKREATSNKPKITPRNKGIAYFFKGYLQIRGVSQYRAGDTISLNDREYTLEQKKLNDKARKLVYGSIFVIGLLIVASFFIKNNDGHGSLAGVVFQSDNNEFVKGAEIYLPELDKSIKSNTQGFFVFDNLPSGTHEVQLKMGGELYNSNYITVADSKTSTISLILKKEELAKAEIKTQRKPIAQAKPKTKSSPNRSSKKQASSQSKSSPSVASKPSASESIDNTPAKLTLSANVEGAKIKLGYQVLGAGNLTYKNVNPGTHKYRVSADGYQDATGTINLGPGQSKILVVNLTPITTAAKAEEFDSKDYYYSGVTALNEKRYSHAIEDLSQSISMDPSSAGSWYNRGLAHSKIGENEKAMEDLIRSAEIFTFRKDYNSAFKSYNKAIKIDNKSMTSLLGRGSLYLTRNKARAALADFETALRLDKKNFAANFGMGQVRYKQANYKKAIDYFKKARKINKKNPLVYQYLMLSYMGRDDHKNLKKSFKKFKDVATQQELDRFASDKKYSAVRRIIEIDN